jgi:hypothetical protein
LPDGDLLFSLESDAADRFLAERSSAKWSTLYCPAAWDVSGARVDDIRGMIGRSADARLRPVAVDAVQPAAIGILTIMAGLCVWWLVTPKASAPVPDVPVVPPTAPSPWVDQPPSTWLIESCADAIARVQMVPGYDVEAVVCGPTGVEANYRRHAGSIAWLASEFHVVTADRVTRHTLLPNPIARRPAGEQVWPADELRRMIWGAAQSFALDSEVTDVSGRIDAGHTVPTGDHNREIAVVLGGSLAPPGVLAAILGAIPAFVVEDVTWKPSGWTVKGKAYVR